MVLELTKDIQIFLETEQHIATGVKTCSGPRRAQKSLAGQSTSCETGLERGKTGGWREWSGVGEEVEEGAKEATLRADGFIYVSESLNPWFNLTLEDWWVIFFFLVHWLGFFY